MIAALIASASFVTLVLSMVTLGPLPSMSVPIIFDVPRGSLKYPAIAFFTCGVEFNSHSTMNSDIIAVTKSAYATFHAPP